MEKSPAGRNHQLAGITSWQFTSWQMIHHLIAVTSWQFPIWVTSWQESPSDMSHQLVGVTIWPDPPAGMSHQLTRVTSWYESPSGRNHQLVWVNIWQESPAGMNHHLTGVTSWYESPSGRSHQLARSHHRLALSAVLMIHSDALYDSVIFFNKLIWKEKVSRQSYCWIFILFLKWICLCHCKLLFACVIQWQPHLRHPFLQGAYNHRLPAVKPWQLMLQWTFVLDGHVRNKWACYIACW